jgi:LysM repeat protein
VTVIRRTGIVLRGLLAAAVLVVLVAGVPAALVATVGNPVPEGWTWGAPLTNSALLGILACVAWVLWVQLLVCVVVETVAEIRLAAGHSADWLARVPGTFGVQQSLARTLVQAVVAIGATTTAASIIASPWISHADAATSSPAPAAEPAVADAPAAVGAARRATAKHRSQPTTEVVVARGDTLWSIAEQRLGAGERWREIAELNRDREMVDGSRFDDARTILPGWTLLVPSADPSHHSAVTVAPGDTLWEIATDEYGDATKWPRIYRANDDQIEDPDLIYPGQRLDVPGPRTAEPSKPPTEHQTDPPAADTTTRPQEPGPTDHAVPSSEPTPESTPTDSANAAVEAGQEHDDATDDSGFQVDGATVARALLSGGSFLAAGMLSVYIARRRTQARNRKSGKAAPPVAEPLRAEDKALRAIGSSASERAAYFDALLRELPALSEQAKLDLPEAVAASLGSHALELHLRTPSQTAPPPWTVSQDGTVWSVSTERRPTLTDRTPAYPAMATVGVDDEGRTLFIDIEGAGVVQIVGDAAAAVELARFMAAELALNPWSDCESVEVSGGVEDVLPLNYGRLYASPKAEVEQLAKFAHRMAEGVESAGTSVLGSRVADRDACVPSLSITALANEDLPAGREHTATLLDEMERAPGRTSAGLVVVAADVVDPRAITLEFTSDGNLVTPWGVVQPNRLTAEEAAVLAQLFEDVETEGDVDVPAAVDAHGETTNTDQAGAIAQELTEARCGTGDPESMLPRPDRAYVESAATTVEDLAVLAPAVPKSEEAAALAADPTLDQDLADWADPECPRPKLRVLGPVELRAVGEKTAEVEGRPAYYSELAAYLACHPEGVTPNRVAADFGIQNNTLHSRLTGLRKWMGNKPGSEEWYLPVAHRVRGQQVYQLSEVLVDGDLFRRLRARGEARGPRGIDDFKTALELVAGQPYERQRSNGFGWLVDTPVDQYAVVAIVDVAHVYATHSLAEGRPRDAMWAAERAIAAAPSEDKPRLDLAKAMQALGELDEADRYLGREVFNRTDDDRAPLDPSDRTKEIFHRMDRLRRP